MSLRSYHKNASTEQLWSLRETKSITEKYNNQFLKTWKNELNIRLEDVKKKKCTKPAARGKEDLMQDCSGRDWDYYNREIEIKSR